MAPSKRKKTRELPCATKIGCHPQLGGTRQITKQHRRYNITRMNGRRTWLPDKKSVTPIPIKFYQGQTVSCWAVVVAMALQVYYLIHGDTDIGISMPSPNGPLRVKLQLSPQTVINCLPCPEPGTIEEETDPWVQNKLVLKEGWSEESKSYTTSTRRALEYLKIHEIGSIKETKYTGVYRRCKRFKPLLAPVGFVNLKMQYDNPQDDDGLPLAEDSVINNHLDDGALLGCVECYDYFDTFEGGEDVYQGVPKPKEEPTYHAMLVIGSGVSKGGVQYFEVLNTYTNWGIEGVGRIDKKSMITLEAITGVYKYLHAED